MTASTWPGRPAARVIGRVLALIAAILTVLFWGCVLQGQSARRVPVHANPHPFPFRGR